MNDSGDTEGFIDSGTIGSQMEHIRFDIKDRQNDKSKVIVSGDEYLCARIAGILAEWIINTIRAEWIINTFSVHSGGAHLRSYKIKFIRANRNI